MNTSKLTEVIARGIYLYSVIQDMPGNMVEGSKAKQVWDDWCYLYPQYVQYVKDEQSQLFDRLLSK